MTLKAPYETVDVTVPLATGGVAVLGTVQVASADLPLETRVEFNENAALNFVTETLDLGHLPGVAATVRFPGAVTVLQSAATKAQYPQETPEFRGARARSLATRLVRELGVDWLALRHHAWGQARKVHPFEVDTYTVEVLDRAGPSEVFATVLKVVTDADPFSVPLSLPGLTASQAYHVAQRIRVLGGNVLVTPNDVTRNFPPDNVTPPPSAVWRLFVFWSPVHVDRNAVFPLLTEAYGDPLAAAEALKASALGQPCPPGAALALGDALRLSMALEKAGLFTALHPEAPAEGASPLIIL